MWEIIAIAVVVLIAAVLVFAAVRPDALSVQRTTSINAAPDKIFPFIEDFNRWRVWSPYENKDPAMKRTVSGAGSGKGAVYEWDGNSQVGKGRIEITDASAPSRVTIKLDMLKPMEGHNIVNFTLEPRGGATQVTWAMRGSCAYMHKVMGLFLDMDKMIGKDFEIGLANLKTQGDSPLAAPGSQPRGRGWTGHCVALTCIWAGCE
ncbi:MAG TPA: SRPBCC family protein [Xanthobacteraceae bacterium]|nr:SRPBCC family protein [Xanthobacteraceae bacterium]